MIKRGRTFVAPAYLFACLLLGGSAQGIWQNMLLQLAGVAIIAWAALDNSDEPLAPSAKQLFLLLLAFIFVVACQLIPIPAAIWTHLGPRQNIADGYITLGIPITPQPLTLTPASTFGALLAIIPPVALLGAMVRLRGYRVHLLALAFIIGAVLGTALGSVQVATSSSELSPWYLYDETNPGKAVGFFANADHMAMLLVITIPFLAALVRSARRERMHRYFAIIAVAAAISLVVIVGLALNGSLAGYAIALPVIFASALIVVPRHSRARTWILAAAALLLVASVATLEITPIGSGKIGEHTTSAVQSRAEILSTTSHAIADFMPFGSGLGSFLNVYPLYESPERVTAVYVIHAHNDYVEAALELGLAGIALMLLFLTWWAVAVWRIWRTVEARPFARAATIASAAILVHSLVDFPLRTAAISACFAMCLALLTDSRAAPSRIDDVELRASRHVVI